MEPYILSKLKILSMVSLKQEVILFCFCTIVMFPSAGGIQLHYLLNSGSLSQFWNAVNRNSQSTNSFAPDNSDANKVISDPQLNMRSELQCSPGLCKSQTFSQMRLASRRTCTGSHHILKLKPTDTYCRASILFLTQQFIPWYDCHLL
jgi:hypothetical protein